VHLVTVVRAPVLFLIALCGCPSPSAERGLAAEDNGGGAGSGSAGGIQSTCVVAEDCILAAARCCDCPTYAVPANDPAQDACLDVECVPVACGSPLVAACEAGRCVAACAPVACDAAIACPDGFATDENGCLTCTCAGVADVGGECTFDTDCARVRDDCCGCDNGGADTAVPEGQITAHDAGLMCPSDPVCPGGNSCMADLAARCIQGTCSLVAGPLPAGACGRDDLPPCPVGEACYVNANDGATMQGVGVCQP
jgi:Antistasin family